MVGDHWPTRMNKLCSISPLAIILLKTLNVSKYSGRFLTSDMKIVNEFVIRLSEQLIVMINTKSSLIGIAVVGILSVIFVGSSSFVATHHVFGQQGEVFKARLAGTEEVPPNESPAGGSAWVKTTNDKIEYEVNVTDIDKVNAAHIHLGEKGKNGPVILTLFKDDPTELKTGKLAEANVTASNLEGPMKGKGVTDLVSAIKNGTAYVNVHSTDFPDGEIRGELQANSAQ